MAVFFNQATLSYNNTVTNSNTVTGEIIETLSIVKTALDTTYTQGDTLAYAISIINTGEADYTGVTVTDDLGAYQFDETTQLMPLEYVENSVRLFVNGGIQPDPRITKAADLVIENLTIPAGGSVLIFYEADVTGFAPLGEDGAITNTASLTGAGISDTLASTAVTRASTEPELTVSKSISPSEVEKNGTLTYSFLISNSGSVEAGTADNVSLTDIFDPVLNDISVTLNGAEFSAANYSYDETTGEFVTNPGAITVPAASFVQNPDTGEWASSPGTVLLIISGTV